MRASGNLGERIQVVEKFLSSCNQDFYPATSVDENYIEVQFSNVSEGLRCIETFFLGFENEVVEKSRWRYLQKRRVREKAKR